MTLSLTIYALCIFSAAFLGGLLPLLIPKADEDHFRLFVGLGAGLLLGMAFLHMLPEAVHRIPEEFGAWFLIGFVLLFVIERFAMVHACEEHHCDYHRIGIAAFVGLTVHGVIEGFALASSYYVSQSATLVLAAILTHKVPAGVALTAMLKLGSRTRNQILLFVLGVALSGPIGIVLASSLFHSGFEHASGRLLALSGGTFVYIGACDLVPELHRSQKNRTLKFAMFLAGIALSFAMELTNHGH